jgi:hypothetical protein
MPDEKSSTIFELRSFDGSRNNELNPTWGKAHQVLLREPTEASYKDGLHFTRTTEPRKISNAFCNKISELPSPNLSSFMWAWGQFVDHEITLVEESHNEIITAITPSDDPVSPGAMIRLRRSLVAKGTGNPREQENVLSAYVDASNVYGASLERAIALRMLDGTGRLKFTESEHGPLLPYNTSGLHNLIGPLRKDSEAARFFVAGDVRANEHNVLTCLHTLFMREHNRICDELAVSDDPQLKSEILKSSKDEAIFQRARRIVGALEQVITYEEFLPALLGPNFIQEYRGYDPKVNAGITNLFSTAAYRLGHDMLNAEISRFDPDGQVKTKIQLHDMFFKPEEIEKHGINGYLQGLSVENMEAINGQIVDSVRSHLFNVDTQVQPKGMPKLLLDLPALNILRGRDHGLPSYNQCRVAYGLEKRESIEAVTTDPVRCRGLQAAYDSVDDIDPWIGGLAEDHVEGAQIGELFHKVVSEQFLKLRNGDRFWYENDPAFSDKDRNTLRETTLGDVIARNADLVRSGRHVFDTTKAQPWQWKRHIKAPKNISAIAVDPNNAGTIYVGTQAHGIYMSSDDGETWVYRSRGLGKSLSIQTLAIHKTNSNYLYAGTANGLFKSSDNAASWVSMMSRTIYAPGPTATVGGAPSHLSGGQAAPNPQIYSLVLHPEKTGTVYAAIREGLCITTDDGKSWSLQNHGSAGPLDASFIVMNSKNPRDLYFSSNTSLTKSIQAGYSWHRLAYIPGPCASLAIAWQDGRNYLYAGSSTGGIFKLREPYSFGSGDLPIRDHYGPEFGILPDLTINWDLLDGSAKLFDSELSSKSKSSSFIFIDPEQQKNVYVGTEMGLYRIDEDTVNPEPILNRETKCIAVDPKFPGKIYAGGPFGFVSGSAK